MRLWRSMRAQRAPAAADAKGTTDKKPPTTALLPPLMALVSSVPTEYRVLHRYLNERYADMVVLSFDQIEGLLGATLPTLAYSREWWGANADGSPTGQSKSWTEAGRTARPNVLARNVAFERLPVR